MPSAALSTALRRGDWPWIAGFVQGRFGLDVSAAVLADLCGELLDDAKHVHDGNWTESTCVMWLKNRIAPLLASEIGRNFDEVRFTCELHFWFIHIEETPEMLARLRNETPRPWFEGTARSRISKTQQRIRPVNRVAERVLPEPAQGEVV